MQLPGNDKRCFQDGSAIEFGIVEPGDQRVGGGGHPGHVARPVVFCPGRECTFAMKDQLMERRGGSGVEVRLPQAVESPQVVQHVDELVSLLHLRLRQLLNGSRPLPCRTEKNP